VNKLVQFKMVKITLIYFCSTIENFMDSLWLVKLCCHGR
jgi:hypothetical protein